MNPYSLKRELGPEPSASANSATSAWAVLCPARAGFPTTISGAGARIFWLPASGRKILLWARMVRWPEGRDETVQRLARGLSMVSRCTSCDRELPSGISFCPNCGRALNLPATPLDPEATLPLVDAPPSSVESPEVLSCSEEVPVPELPAPLSDSSGRLAEPQELPNPYFVPALRTPISGLAIAAILCAFFIPPVGLVLACLGIATIRYPMRGRGLAWLALIIGLSGTGCCVVNIH